MYRKSLAGADRLICSVYEFGADRPEMLFEFWKLAMLAAVGGCDLLANYAVSALAYALSPEIVDS